MVSWIELLNPQIAMKSSIAKFIMLIATILLLAGAVVLFILIKYLI